MLALRTIAVLASSLFFGLLRCGGEKEEEGSPQGGGDYEDLEQNYRSLCFGGPGFVSKLQGCGVSAAHKQIAGPSEASLYIPPTSEELSQLLYWNSCQVDCTWPANSLYYSDGRVSLCQSRLTLPTEGGWRITSAENQSEDPFTRDSECRIAVR